MSAWADAVAKRYGRIDVLVNNAGITRDALLLRMKEADWDLVMSINLKGAFLCTRAVVRYMAQQRSGRIVNVASVVGVVGNVGQANYVASKAGLIGLTKTVAREFAARGITVNAVAPGFIETQMTAVLSDKVKEAFLAQIPLGRAGSPEDVAARGDLSRLRPGSLPDRPGAARERRDVHVTALKEPGCLGIQLFWVSGCNQTPKHPNTKHPTLNTKHQHYNHRINEHYGGNTNVRSKKK